MELEMIYLYRYVGSKSENCPKNQVQTNAASALGCAAKMYSIRATSWLLRSNGGVKKNEIKIQWVRQLRQYFHAT